MTFTPRTYYRAIKILAAFSQMQLRPIDFAVQGDFETDMVIFGARDYYCPGPYSHGSIYHST